MEEPDEVITVLMASCRICMAQGGQMNPLFGADPGIVERIRYCTGIQICKDDGFPNNICDKCLLDLPVAHQFKASCLLSQHLFEKLLKKKANRENCTKHQVSNVEETDECLELGTSEQEEISNRPKKYDRTSKEQREWLRSRVSSDPDLSSGYAGPMALPKWEALMEELNALGPVVKTTAQWHKVYQDMKYLETKRNQRALLEVTTETEISVESNSGDRNDHKIVYEYIVKDSDFESNVLKMRDNLNETNDDSDVWIVSSEANGYGDLETDTSENEDSVCKRRIRSSFKQRQCLLRSIFKNPVLGETFKDKNQKTRMTAERQWKELTRRLNAMGPAVKDYIQWQVVWRDMKSKVKTKKMRSLKKSKANVLEENVIQDLLKMLHDRERKGRLMKQASSETMEKQKRANPVQKKLLMEVVKKDPDLTRPPSDRRFKAKWQKLADRLNRYGPVKTPVQWQVTWRDIKYKKRKVNGEIVTKKEQERKRRETVQEILKQFGGDNNIQPRVNEQHKRDKRRQCEICGSILASSSSYIAHLRSHLPPRYWCDHCAYRTHYKSDLVSHMRVHTGDRNFKCTQCTAAYCTSSNLLRHKRRVHDRERNCICHYCSAAFFQKASLMAHLDSHNQIKRFKCDVCSAMFARRRSWARHMVRRHDVQVPPCRAGRKKVNRVVDIPDEVVFTNLT